VSASRCISPSRTLRSTRSGRRAGNPTADAASRDIDSMRWRSSDTAGARGKRTEASAGCGAPPVSAATSEIAGHRGTPPPQLRPRDCQTLIPLAPYVVRSAAPRDDECRFEWRRGFRPHGSLGFRRSRGLQMRERPHHIGQPKHDAIDYGGQAKRYEVGERPAPSHPESKQQHNGARTQTPLASCHRETATIAPEKSASESPMSNSSSDGFVRTSGQREAMPAAESRSAKRQRRLVPRPAQYHQAPCCRGARSCSAEGGGNGENGERRNPTTPAG